MMRPAPIAHVPSGTGSFLAAPASLCTRSATTMGASSPIPRALRRTGPRDWRDSLDVCGIVHSARFGNPETAVSTRTYIVLAALTGVVILVAFAFQVILVNR